MEAEAEVAWWPRMVKLRSEMRAQLEVGNRDTDTDTEVAWLEFVLRELKSKKVLTAVKRGHVQLLLEEINQLFMKYRGLKIRHARRNRNLGGQEPGEAAKIELDVEGQSKAAKVELDVEELSSLLKEMHLSLLEYEEPEESKEATKRDTSSSKEASKEDAGMVEKSSKKGLKGKRLSKAEKKIKKDLKIKKELLDYEEYKRRKAEEERNWDPEELRDPYAFQARRYKETWDTYMSCFGRFEDNTSIPCKRYTFNPAPSGGITCDTLQVFSVKVTELTGGLQWPINVFGMVALRDSLDRNRNIIFKCERDNCQTLTDQNPYLVLTGPVRGVVFCGYVVFEVLLYVRGATESDDKELSLLAVSFRKWNNSPSKSLWMMNSYPSRHSTMEFEVGQIIYSVEATISMKVISWPRHGFFGRFVAKTGSLKPEILLHISGVEEMHCTGDEINLSRSVVSVEVFGKLMVSVSASDGSATLMGTTEFKPQEQGTSSGELHITGLCKLDITVAWSVY